MKRVLCPKCDNYITFDETKYTEGQSLVFVCDHCKKQFSIRIGKSKLKATRKEEILDEQANKEGFWKYRGSRKCIRIQTSITPDGR